MDGGMEERSGGGGERVDAVRGVTAIRIETVHVALLRHHPHTLSGAGSTHSASVRVCVFVFSYLTHTDYKDMHFNSKVRTFFRNENILTGPQNFKGGFKGKSLVLWSGLGSGAGSVITTFQNYFFY